MNLFASLLHALPKRAISRLAGVLARSETRPVAQALIRAFAHYYRVDLCEAALTSAIDYGSFNDFFTRALNDGARPMPTDPGVVVSPCDGYLSQFGPIEAGRLLQAKGNHFSVETLLTDASLAADYDLGSFFTVYLSPRDYHRVHAPIGGLLTRTIEVPGQLFSVNDATAGCIANLFCKNERLVCVFDGYVLVLVGALIVASIETAWSGPRSPYRIIRTRQVGTTFDRGAEVGRFLLGSTVIALFPRNALQLDGKLETGMPVRLGQPVGSRPI